MFSLYLFALIVGGGLLLFSLFSGSDHHHQGGFDHAGDHGSAGEWLSLRTLTYFLFVFGGVGAVLSRSWHAAAAPLVLLAATASGLAIGGAVATAFSWLRRTDTTHRESDDSFIGLSGRMTLPFGPGGAGKVLVARGDRTFELLARPYDRASGPPSTWNHVIVVEMERGTALVAPLDDPAVRELASINQL